MLRPYSKMVKKYPKKKFVSINIFASPNLPKLASHRPCCTINDFKHFSNIF